MPLGEFFETTVAIGFWAALATVYAYMHLSMKEEDDKRGETVAPSNDLVHEDIPWELMSSGGGFNPDWEPGDGPNAKAALVLDERFFALTEGGLCVDGLDANSPHPENEIARSDGKPSLEKPSS